MGLGTIQESSLLRPIAISLILHVCLILRIYNSTFSLKPAEQSLVEQVNSIEVILVERRPQSPPDIEISVEEEATEENGQEIVGEIAEESKNTLAEVQEQEAESGNEISTENESFSVEPLASVPVETDPSDENLNTNPASTEGLNSAGVASAISSYMTTYGEKVNQDWVSHCNNYKIKHGSRDCPQQYGKYDIRPVYRNYKPPGQFSSFQEKRDIARLEFLQGVMKNSEFSSNELYAVNQLKQHYMFMLNPEPAWTPNAPADKFNPDLIAPAAELIKVTDKGIWIFGIGEINFLNFQYDPGEATFWYYPDPDVEESVVLPPLLPAQR